MKAWTFFKEAWGLLRHDKALFRAGDAVAQERAVKSHLEAGCIRCKHFFGHIFEEPTV